MAGGVLQHLTDTFLEENTKRKILAERNYFLRLTTVGDPPC
jgi:hypothetical protein